MTFNKWLKSKWREDSAAGDLARDARQDPEWPSHGRTYKCFKDHLFNMNACSRAEDALLQAWRRWEAEELPPKAPIEPCKKCLAEKDKEIERLKDERDGFKNGQQQMQDINCKLFKSNNALGRDIREKDKEIERLEGEIAEKDEKIKLLIKDAVIMALRLYGEDRATFGPECYEVMERWTELVELRLKVNNNYKTTK